MPIVAAINKIDVEGPLEEAGIRELLDSDVQRTCALSGRGVNELRDRMFASLVGEDLPAADAPVVTTASVAAALAEAIARLDSAESEASGFDTTVLE